MSALLKTLIPAFRGMALLRSGPMRMIGCLFIVLVLSGCGSAQPDYYTLTSVAGVAQTGGPASVEVQAPTVAAYLSRDYIVLSNTGDQLHLSRDAAWAEPLSEAIGRNLALDLSQRLPGTIVFSSGNGVSEPKVVVNVSISRFAEDDAGRAEIAAMVFIHRPGGAVIENREMHFVAPLKHAGADALADMLSHLLGQLADQTAIDLRALGPSGRSS